MGHAQKISGAPQKSGVSLSAKQLVTMEAAFEKLRQHTGTTLDQKLMLILFREGDREGKVLVSSEEIIALQAAALRGISEMLQRSYDEERGNYQSEHIVNNTGNVVQTLGTVSDVTKALSSALAPLSVSGRKR